LASEEAAKKFTDEPIFIQGLGLGTDSMRPGDRLADFPYAGFKEMAERYPDYARKPLTPYPEMANFAALHVAALQAYEEAGIKNPLEEIDFGELFCPYSGVELSLYEDLMLCKRGEAKDMLRAGVTQRDGEFPTQLSGAQQAFTHPVGATTLLQAIYAMAQLWGKVEEWFGDGTLQLDNPRRALLTGHGGTGCQGGVIIIGRE
jgi:acetyl-CoA C-acetyltransferase